MLIFKLWLWSKPKYSRYMYQGIIYTKDEEFLEIEKNLYAIRYGLRVLFMVMTLSVSIIKREFIVLGIMWGMLSMVVGDFITLPMYYVKLREILGVQK